MENRFGFLKPLAPVGLVCLTLLLCVFVAASAFKNRGRANDLLTVTGAAKSDFSSDLIEWNMSVVTRNPTMKGAFAAIRADAEKVQQFLVGKGIPAAEIVQSAVTIDREYETQFVAKDQSKQVFKDFKLTQNVRVESTAVEKVEVVSREISSLIEAGVEVYSNAPNYYYTKLGELKIAMIAEATKDGRLRAEQIARNAGGSLGGLRYSSLGVFQITGANSNAEYSWGGSFDTASKKKSAAITVKLQFGVH